MPLLNISTEVIPYLPEIRYRKTTSQLLISHSLSTVLSLYFKTCFAEWPKSTLSLPVHRHEKVSAFVLVFFLKMLDKILVLSDKT